MNTRKLQIIRYNASLYDRNPDALLDIAPTPFSIIKVPALHKRVQLSLVTFLRAMSPHLAQIT